MAVSNRKILVSGLFQYAIVGVQVLVQFSSIFFLSRLLTPKDFGKMGIILILIAFANIIGQLGIGPYFVYNTKATSDEVNKGFTISLLMGLFLAALFYVSAPLFAAFFTDESFVPLIRVSALSFLFASAASIPENLLERSLKFKNIFWVNSLSLVIGYFLVSLVMAYLGYGVWSLIWGNICQYLSKFILLFFLSPSFPRLSFNFGGLKEIFQFSAGFTLARLFNFFATRGDNFLVGKFLGMEFLGIYSRAYQLMMLFPTYAGAAFEKVLYPVFSHEKENQSRLLQLFVTMNMVILSLTLPVSLIFVLFSKEIVLVVLGEQWMEASIPLAILSVGIYFRTSYKLGDSLAKSQGQVFKRSIREMVYAGLVIGSVCLLYNFGLNAISAGILGAILVNYYTSFSLAAKILKVPFTSFFLSKKPLAYFSIYFLMVLITRYFTWQIEIHPLVTLLMLFVLTCSVFGIASIKEFGTLKPQVIYKKFIKDENNIPSR
jgi:PST family polysaccharide transporter